MGARILFGCLLATALCGMLLVVGIRQAHRFWWSQADADASTYDVTISDGERFGTIFDELRAHGVNVFWFRVYTKLTGHNGRDAKPGTYTLTEGMNYASIASVFTVATTTDVILTVPEGFTLAQMGERVVATFPHIVSDEWLTATGQFSPLESHPFVVVAGKPDDVDLEGYLFPDTYAFSDNATAEDIVVTMIDTMRDRVATVGLAEEVGDGKTFATLHEALTLASIVEKEVRQPETMAMVADIFAKRLAIGMALQSDATVNYVTGGDDPSISLADAVIDSPYNTYKYAGLPPGPISNPGLNALAAVATPAKNAYYYFLTTDEGAIHYAETHAEHVANKARYLR